MKSKDLIEEILRLPLEEQKKLIQLAQNLVKVADNKSQMGKAAEQLVTDYETDYELTAFTDIDMDEFYEAN
ncbi:MAG: hypothetical protein WD530_04400 [Vicingaceae bacterium]